MKKNISTIIMILILLAGIALILYPSFSNHINSLHQTKAVAVYDAAASEISEEDHTAFFKQAQTYNQELLRNPEGFYHPDQIAGYHEALNIDGSEIMGYITIEKIGVVLPIYHGTSEEVLNIACGHLEGSSLPVGGEGTHCILSAHRGLPSAKLFTDLDQMEPDDLFTITILDRVITYEVQNIYIVDPYDVEKLKPVQGEDLCTLFTCTPYGINSHRLLVQGRRTDNAVNRVGIHVVADGYLIDPMIVTPIAALPVLILLILGIIFYPKRKNKGGNLS